MRRAYDAIVIGAGVMGASVAFHLARAGAGRIAIVERRAVCPLPSAYSSSCARTIPSRIRPQPASSAGPKRSPPSQ